MEPNLTLQDVTFNLLPWVVFIPLIGLLLNMAFGRRLGEKFSGWVGSLATILTFALSLYLAIRLGSSGEPQAQVVNLADWIKIGALNISWGFRLDTLSAVMMLVVSGVGALIHIYSIGYMHADVRHNGDPNRFSRFFVYLNLFIASMMLLVTADNYLMLFVGWEGVGLCSYLLIGFWYEKGKDGIANAQAAKKAFVVNRIGDFGLLIALFLMLVVFGTVSFDGVFAGAGQPEILQSGVVVVITLLMLLGVAGKSAQLPMYVWLPDAMAGPTPVSALIHAATMVTAGVYLIVRSQPLFSAAPVSAEVATWVGALTAIFAATIAVAQFDIKKVLAYSTISQLGFMVAAVGMGAFTAGMFHLATHAFFKALLFLSAGSVILGMERGAEAGHGHEEHGGDHIDPQDMRNMGGLYNRMPRTFWVYLAGALALAGIVPFAGFFSKDEILGAAAQTHLAVYIILVVTAFLTAFYMGRQVLMIFFGQPRSKAAAHALESPMIISIPLLLLAILSIAGGALNLPGQYFLEHWLEASLTKNLAVPFEWPVATISLVLALTGLVLAWGVYGRRKLFIHPEEGDPLARTLGPVFKGMQNKWWVDELYGFLFVKPYQALAGFFAGWLDQGVIDGIVNGFGALSRGLAGLWSKLQNGYVRSYAAWVALGVAGILIYLVLR